MGGSPIAITSALFTLSALPPPPVYQYYTVPFTLAPLNPLPFLPLPHTFTMSLFTPHNSSLPPTHYSFLHTEIWIAAQIPVMEFHKYNVVTSGTSWFISNQFSSLMRGRDGLWEDLSACEELWAGVREENFPITLSSKVRLYFVNLPT